MHLHTKIVKTAILYAFTYKKDLTLFLYAIRYNF